MPIAPYRGPFGADRPAELRQLALPPDRLPAFHRLRPRKHWRYVGGYGERVMFCVLSFAIGPLRQSSWAVWDREHGRFLERTGLGHRGVEVREGHVRVASADVEIDLKLVETPGLEVVSPAKRNYIWTRKQLAGTSGTITVDGRSIPIEQTVLIDDSAGYHSRHTSWQWSAGIGKTDGGSAVAWNLVRGVHDNSRSSERTVWIDGEPHEIGPVAFDDGLDTITFGGSEQLTFTPERERARNDNLILIRSRYRQPFGHFGGELPLAGRLSEGFGVMEEHNAYW